MTKRDFINTVLNDFGANTSVNKTYTEMELLATYEQYLSTRPAKSPLKTDNKLSRQAFLTELFEQEKPLQDKAFMLGVLGNVIKLKKLVREAGVTLVKVVSDEDKVKLAEAIYDTAYAPIDHKLLVNVVTGVTTPFADVDGTNAFEAMCS
jgi:hypothetical protein